jgi:hypothetical protein
MFSSPMRLGQSPLFRIAITLAQPGINPGKAP